MQVCDFEIADIHFTIYTFDKNEGTLYRGEEIDVVNRSQYLNIHQHITYECFLPVKQIVLFTDNGYKAYEKECVIVSPGKRHFMHGNYRVLEPGGINHSDSSRNNQFELIRNSQFTCLAN